MTLISILDLFGVFVFAITGALAANRSGMDIFGHIVMAMLPAVGGGTLRDIILGAPVFWTSAPIYVWIVLAAAALIFFFPPKVGRRLTLLEWADAVGLALFCGLGTAKAYHLTGNITVSVTMGVVTAAVGGMLRDIVINEVPLILQKEVYATAALIGGLVYCAAYNLSGNEALSLGLCGGVAFAIRGCALIWGWSLPSRGLPKSKE